VQPGTLFLIDALNLLVQAIKRGLRLLQGQLQLDAWPEGQGSSS